QQPQESRHIFCRGVGHYFQGILDPNKISHYRMTDQQGNERKNYHLPGFLENLFLIPRHRIQLPLLVGIPFYPIFDLTEHHLHKQRLRTKPSAKYASKYGRKENDKDHKDQQHEYQKVGVLGPKHGAKNDEFVFKKIQKQQGLPVYLYKWSGK